MKRLRFILGIGLLAGCQEELALPSTCPELCPGSGLSIQDTTIDAVAGRDSSFTGYLSVREASALLVSNGLSAGDARSWATFSKLPDSIFVLGLRYTYTIDSLLIKLQVLSRDTLVKDLHLIVHRIPFVDTTATVADLDQHLTPETVIDSVIVPDSVRGGDSLKVRIRPEAWSKLTPDETDTARFAVGFRITAPEPTGLRLGSTFGGSGPILRAYVQIPSNDTTIRRQTLTIPADSSNFVIQAPPPTDPNNLIMGGRTGSRTLIRFQLPRRLTDSAIVLRATLELTLAQPVRGLPTDRATLQALATLVDVGAKSPAFTGAAGTATLETGATGLQQIEVLGPVSTWFSPTPLPSTLLLGLAPEGGTFTLAEFLSTRAATGGPRLRITYALSTRPGFP